MGAYNGTDWILSWAHCGRVVAGGLPVATDLLVVGGPFEVVLFAAGLFPAAGDQVFFLVNSKVPMGGQPVAMWTRPVPHHHYVSWDKYY